MCQLTNVGSWIKETSLWLFGCQILFTMEVLIFVEKSQCQTNNNTLMKHALLVSKQSSSVAGKG
jgi:hypothetical protein